VGLEPIEALGLSFADVIVTEVGRGGVNRFDVVAAEGGDHGLGAGEEAVELQIAPAVSTMTIQRSLKKTRCALT
jgi:hypothetical protein